MDCFSCKKPYNEKENIPRLLTECGHSMCDKCLKIKFFNGTITCPECKS